jgi:hypothetical protein
MSSRVENCSNLELLVCLIVNLSISVCLLVKATNALRAILANLFAALVEALKGSELELLPALVATMQSLMLFDMSQELAMEPQPPTSARTMRDATLTSDHRDRMASSAKRRPFAFVSSHSSALFSFPCQPFALCTNFAVDATFRETWILG